MEKEIKILCGLLADMQPEQRLQLITAAKICHKFLWHIEEYKEVDRNKVHKYVKNNPELVQIVAKHLELQETSRLSSPIAKRPGKVWKSPPKTRFCGRGTKYGNPYKVIGDNLK